jgi:hypothetical protein
MSRQFSIPTVLRMTPNALLAECFQVLGHGDFDPRWPDLKKQEIDPILDYLGDLPTEQLNEMESVLRSVFDLACESGFDAILEAGPHCGVADLGALVPDDLCVWGRAMWVWLQHRKVFDKAQVIHQVEHMAWWRRRNDLPQNAPDTSPAAREKLERDISTLLKAQGRGKDCTVEMLTRGSVDYFFAYPDDFVQNVTVHDGDGRLAPEAFRQTLLIVFAYNREEGSLETYAKLTKPVKEKLEALFASAILHWELDAYDPDAAYELDQLKDPSFDLTPDPIQFDDRPSYIYRWYTAHSSHLSAMGASGYERLGTFAAERVTQLEPRWDRDWVQLHQQAITKEVHREHARTV